MRADRPRGPNWQEVGVTVPRLTEEGRRIVDEIAARHGVSDDAVLTLLSALAAGHGAQAQFSHPDLGGMGQWSRGGMIMVGDMFNSSLKARVDALCTELSGLLETATPFAAPAQSQTQTQGRIGVSLSVPSWSTAWWPDHLGTPASVGAQNDLRYAFFPATRRLAIEIGGRTSLYDTGEHQISGVSQQQGSGQSITFTSQLGLVRVADLPLVSGRSDDAAPAEPSPVRPEAARRTPAGVEEAAEPPPAPPAPTGSRADDDVFAKIERLAELRRKDILTEEEYAKKKAELLARL
jgi:hypothetical protein